MKTKIIERYMTPVSEVYQNIPVCDFCHDDSMYVDNTLFYCRSCAEKRIYRDFIREAYVILNRVSEIATNEQLRQLQGIRSFLEEATELLFR